MRKLKKEQEEEENKPVQEVEMVQDLLQIKEESHHGMNVGHGERIQEKKNLMINFLGVFTSGSSSLEMAHELRIFLLVFLVYFTCWPIFGLSQKKLKQG